MIAKSIKTENDSDLGIHMKKSIVGSLETDELMYQESTAHHNTYNATLG